MECVKTKSEQRVEMLTALDRPLTDQEVAQLEKALHAIYMRDWRLRKAETESGGTALNECRQAELATLEKVLAEART